jgi:hypothetical protein
MKIVLVGNCLALYHSSHINFIFHFTIIQGKVQLEQKINKKAARKAALEGFSIH